jgi:hypothetical protein
MRQFGKGVVVTKCSAFTNHPMRMCGFRDFAKQCNGCGSREKVYSLQDIVNVMHNFFQRRYMYIYHVCGIGFLKSMQK